MKKIPGKLIQVIILLAILGSIFLVQTNSRSSILIKEASYVGGSVLALLVASLGIAIDGRIASERFSRSLAVSLCLLILWMIFRHYAGIHSVNAMKYIYSTIALAGLVFVIAATFTESARDGILWAMVGSTAILSVYAILQSQGIIIFPWDAGLTQMARSSGTMGNANLLGSFSMAMLPVGAGFLLSRFRLSRFRSISSAVFVILCTGAILASKTRGSLIGLLAIAVILPFIPFIRKNRKRLVLMILVFLILIGGSVLLLSNRMEELVHTETGTLQVRQLIWSGTLSMILSNPVLGNGPGSFQILFPEFRNPDYFLLGVSHNTLHAHCEYLEILVDTGIIGLLLWAAVAYSIVRIVYRKRKYFFTDTENTETLGSNWLTLGLLAGIMALMAEASVSVAMRWPPSALLLALFTGLLLASIPSEFTPLKSLRRYGLAVVLLLIAIFLGAVSFPVYLRAMRSGRELFKGKDIYLTHIQFEIENAVNAAEEWRRNGNDEAMQRALYYYDNARQTADSALAWCEQCVETNPDELGGWYALGSAYVSTARLYQNFSPPLSSILSINGITAENYEEADRYMRLGLIAYDSLTSRAPNYAEVHNNLTLVWTNLGYPDSALAEMRKAWDLHAHNRKGYKIKINILNSLTESFDGVYLGWQMSIQSMSKLRKEDLEIDGRNFIIRMLLFDYGITFLRYADSADSLYNELTSIVSNRDSEFASEINEYTCIQIQRMQEGLDILQRFENGDTAGVMRDLSCIPQDELDILPLQRAVKGLILTSEGDIEGMRTITEVLCFLNGFDFNDVTAWPIDVSQMVSELNRALLNTGLDGYDERQMYLLNEINMLIFDRRIFEIMVFIESSPALQHEAADVKEELGIIWEHIGGPFYCFMNTRDDQTVTPVMREASLLENSYSGVLALEAQDSLNAEMIKLDIQWLYIFFCSSYNGIPHYSTVQGEQIVSLLVDTRKRLVDIIGENEAQYQISSMLNDLSILSPFLVRGGNTIYMEALRSDLIMGRINQPDLP
jgi:O-antigen ligase